MPTHPLTHPPTHSHRDITVEFWARTPAFTPRNMTPEPNYEFLSFASYVHQSGWGWRLGRA